MSIIFKAFRSISNAPGRKERKGEAKRQTDRVKEDNIKLTNAHKGTDRRHWKLYLGERRQWALALSPMPTKDAGPAAVSETKHWVVLIKRDQQDELKLLHAVLESPC